MSETIQRLLFWAPRLFCIAFAAFHLVSMWGRLDWSGYAVIEVPLVLLGVLFLVNWRSSQALKARTG